MNIQDDILETISFLEHRAKLLEGSAENNKEKRTQKIRATITALLCLSSVPNVECIKEDVYTLLISVRKRYHLILNL